MVLMETESTSNVITPAQGINTEMMKLLSAPTSALRAHLLIIVLGIVWRSALMEPLLSLSTEPVWNIVLLIILAMRGQTHARKDVMIIGVTMPTILPGFACRSVLKILTTMQISILSSVFLPALSLALQIQWPEDAPLPIIARMTQLQIQ